MQAEIEILDNEIRGLEEYLAANPGWTPPSPSDPTPAPSWSRPVHARCREQRAGCRGHGAGGDSLRAATARIEHVKRLLGVAEEMGIDFVRADRGVLPPVD